MVRLILDSASGGYPVLIGTNLHRELRNVITRLDPTSAAIIARSGLAGRGGGYYPLVKKIRTAIAAHGVPVVVVNATESEPGSTKDRLLAEYRPHLNAALIRR